MVDPQKTTGDSALQSASFDTTADTSITIPKGMLLLSQIHTDALTVMDWVLEKGVRLPQHQHPQEQVVRVITGKLKLSINGTAHLLERDQTAIVPANMPHSAEALEATRTMDIFHPPRRVRITQAE